MLTTISAEHLTTAFLALTTGSAESLDERRNADTLTQMLRDLGFTVFEDDAGAKLGGNAGNLYGCLAGTLPGPPLLFSAHMDTVAPGRDKRPVLHDDGRLTSDGTTVLGADDAAGLCEILEGIRAVRAAGLPHRSIEVLLPVAEEIYIRGSALFDFSRIRAQEAYVLDMSGGVGSAAVQAPSMVAFRVTVTGRASHAGSTPENGIHAIAAAAAAIAQIPQGQIDPETTCNIGTITGGTARNIVPETCVCTGEIRSFSHDRAWEVADRVRAVFEAAAAGYGAQAAVETEEILRAYRVPPDSPIVQRFQRACRTLGLPGTLRTTLGGSDCHNILKAGIGGIVLSCGMYRVHSTEEHTSVHDLVQGAALVAELIRDPV